MLGLPFPRILDVLILGPIKMYLSPYTQNKTLGWLLWMCGILTIVYNFLNMLIMEYSTIPGVFTIIPKWFRTLFFDPVHGKTQLLRLVNLFIMYPMLVMAHNSIKNNTQTPPVVQKINTLFKWTIIGGFIFNGYNYIAITKTGLYV